MNLEEATIKALEGKLKNNKIYIKIGENTGLDYNFNTVEDALNELDDVYSSLYFDAPYLAEYIYLPILDWLHDLEDEDLTSMDPEDLIYTVSQELWDSMDDLAKEDPDHFYEDEDK